MCILVCPSVKNESYHLTLWNIWKLLIYLNSEIYILSFPSVRYIFYHSVKYKSSPLTLKTIDLVILLCEIQFHSWKYDYHFFWEVHILLFHPVKYTSFYLPLFNLENIHLIFSLCKIYIQSFHCDKNILPNSAQAPAKLGWVAIFSANPTTHPHPGKFISQ